MSGSNPGLHRLNNALSYEVGPFIAPTGSAYYRMALGTDNVYIVLFGSSSTSNLLISIIDPAGFSAHTILNSIPASGIYVVDAEASSGTEFYILTKKTSTSQLAVAKVQITSAISCIAPSVSYYNTACLTPASANCNSLCGGICLKPNDVNACTNAGGYQYFYSAACYSGTYYSDVAGSCQAVQISGCDPQCMGQCYALSDPWACVTDCKIGQYYDYGTHTCNSIIYYCFL